MRCAKCNGLLGYVYLPKTGVSNHGKGTVAIRGVKMLSNYRICVECMVLYRFVPSTAESVGSLTLERVVAP